MLMITAFNHTRRVATALFVVISITVLLSFGTARAQDIILVDSGQMLGNCRTFGLALGDLDGDEDLDLVINCFFCGARVLFNDGAGIFSDSGQSLGTIENHGVALGDLDNDEDLDLFMVYNGSQDQIFLNSGLGYFTDTGQALGGIGDNGLTARLGDIDGDNDLDALASNFNQPNRIYINDGNAVFTESDQTIGDNQSRDMCLGDIDADLDLDIYLLNSSAHDQVLLNDGDGFFSDSGQLLGSPTSYGSAKFADLDADLDLDVFLTNADQRSKVFFNDGAGVFTDSGQSLGDGQYQICVVDLDSNRTMDVITAHQDTGTRIWLNDGDGAFSFAAQSPAELRVFAIECGDVDDDDDDDLVFGRLENYGSNRLYFNETLVNISVNEQWGPLQVATLHTYPNPANPRTVVNFTLSDREAISLSVFNMGGRSVVRLAEGVRSQGNHEVVWDGRDSTGRAVPSGVYLIQLQTNRGIARSAVTLVR